MSKKVKTSPVEQSLGLIDLPPEMIDFIGTFPSTGSTRRRLSRGNTYLNKTLEYDSPLRRKIELKETMLEYYVNKKFVLQSVNPEEYTVNVYGYPMLVAAIVHSQEKSTLVRVELGVPIVDLGSAPRNEDTHLTIRPIEQLPEIVRSTMAFIFHTYYNSKEPTPILEIYFTFFELNTLLDFRMTWTSFDTFVNNNPYNILLDALKQKYNSFEYLFSLPLYITKECASTFDQYTELVPRFFSTNEVTIRESNNEQGPEPMVKFRVTNPDSPLSKGTCLVDNNNNGIFSIEFHLVRDDVDLLLASSENLESFTNQILETIQVMLTHNVDILKSVNIVLVYIVLQIDDEDYVQIPYFVLLEKHSFVCRESYIELYPYLNNWLQQVPSIVEQNKFYTILIHESLNVEIIQGNYNHYKTLTNQNTL